MSANGGGTRFPGRRGWLIGVGALALLTLGVGIGTALGSAGAPPAPSPTQPLALPPSAPSATEISRYVVTAGQGGSALGADRRTPIGYPRTCEGAIAAATNYVSSATRLEWVRSHGDALLDQTVDADSRAIEDYREGMRTLLNTGVVMESHPEWGGFRVVDCDQYTAAVDVWECEVIRLNGQAQRSCTAITTVVAWVYTDWKLRRYDVPAAPPVPEETPDTVPDDSPLPADQRRQALQAAGPGWQEYANAPQ